MATSLKICFFFRYKDVVRRLRRLLDAERKNLREVRGEHLNTLQTRTELESLLRMCLDDVKQVSLFMHAINPHFYNRFLVFFFRIL